MLIKSGFAGVVSVLTKSHLVTRDVDLLARLNAIVGLTVTSADDEVSGYFESYASPVSLRLEALGQLHDAGIQTYAFVGPLFPHLVARRESLVELFDRLAEVGVGEVFVEHLNMSPYIAKRLKAKLGKEREELVGKFYEVEQDTYRQELGELVKALLGERGVLVVNRWGDCAPRVSGGR